MERYTVSQVAKIIGVSRVTIYRKLETDMLHGHVTTVNDIKYIDNEGLEILKQNLCNSNVYSNTYKGDTVTSSNVEVTELQGVTGVLHKEIKALKSELEAQKDINKKLLHDTAMLQLENEHLKERLTSKDTHVDKHIESLKAEIESLKGNISTKDSQLAERDNQLGLISASKDKQIEDLTRLLENSQILLKQNQLLLEDKQAKEERERRSFFNWFKK